MSDSDPERLFLVALRALDKAKKKIFVMRRFHVVNPGAFDAIMATYGLCVHKQLYPGHDQPAEGLWAPLTDNLTLEEAKLIFDELVAHEVQKQLTRAGQ